MRKSLLAAALALLVLPSFGTAARAAEPAVTWTPDLVHSRAEFTVSHMVVSKVWGHIPILQLVFVAPKGSVVPERLEATLNVAHAILAESYISFLGYGIQPPTPSWGNMLDNAQNYLTSAPWLAILPGTMIALAVTSFNFIGDGLRDALDPRASGR